MEFLHSIPKIKAPFILTQICLRIITLQKSIFIVTLTIVSLLGSVGWSAITICQISDDPNWLYTNCTNPEKRETLKECNNDPCRTFSLKEYCSNPETLTLEGCKDFPVVERLKDAEAEKLINKGKIISTDTKGRRTILFLKYKSKIYSCTLSTQSNSTTICERSISRITPNKKQNPHLSQSTYIHNIHPPVALVRGF